MLATFATLGTLTVFRRIEDWIPSHSFAQLVLRFDTAQILPEPTVRDQLANQGFSIANMSYRLDRAGGFFEYRMMIRTASKTAIETLVGELRARTDLLEFRISPSGDYGPGVPNHTRISARQRRPQVTVSSESESRKSDSRRDLTTV